MFGLGKPTCPGCGNKVDKQNSIQKNGNHYCCPKCLERHENAQGDAKEQGCGCCH